MESQFVHGNLLEKAHELVSAKIRPGDTVVDATVGNGHDTLFLAHCVGASGRVIGFDVQVQALDCASVLLSGSQVTAELHCVGHENMDMHVPSKVSVVMFNLGYLPGSDKKTITRTETTLTALEKALELLGPGGLLCVMCYPGHEGGDEEAGAVVRFFEDLSAATTFQREGASHRSPFLLLAEKSANL